MQPATRRAAAITSFVRNDLQQPGPKWRVGKKTRQRDVCLEQRLLGNVLSLAGVADDDARQVESSRSVAFGKHAKRRGIACSGAVEKLEIVDAAYYTAAGAVVPVSVRAS